MKNGKNWLVRILAILVVLLMVISGLIFSFAYAEGNGLSVSASASPDGSGTVTITVNLQNVGDYPIDAVTVSGNNIGEEVGGVSQGNTKNVTFTHTVSEEEFESGVPLSIEWVEDGQVKSSSTRVHVERQATEAPETQEPEQTAYTEKNNPQILVKRTIDKESAKVGEEVTVTYTITNTGDSTLGDIILKDSELSDSQLEDAFALEVGEKKVITKTLTMTENGITSKPTIEGTSPAGKKVYDASKKITVEGIPVSAEEMVASPSGQDAITMNVRAGEQTQEGIPVIVTVINAGEKPLDRMVLRDNTGAVISDGVTLMPGETREFTEIVNNAEAKTMTISMEGQIEGEALPIKQTSAPLQIAQRTEAKEIDVTLEAVPVSLTMDKSGDMSVKIAIDNKSDTTLKSVELYEKTRGKLRSLPLLEPGVTRLDDVVVSVVDNETLQFSINLNDPTGKSYQFESKPMDIVVYNPTTTISAETEKEPKTNSMGWLIALIVFIALLVIIAILWVLFWVRNRKNRYLDTDEDEMILEEMDKKREEAVPVTVIQEDDLQWEEAPQPKQRKSPVPNKPQRTTPKPRNINRRNVVDRSARKRIIDIRMDEVEKPQEPEQDLKLTTNIVIETPVRKKKEQDRASLQLVTEPKKDHRPTQEADIAEDMLEETTEEVVAEPLEETITEAENETTAEEEGVVLVDPTRLFSEEFLNEKPKQGLSSKEKKLFDDEFNQ